jgi:hypothetical protein
VFGGTAEAVPFPDFKLSGTAQFATIWEGHEFTGAARALNLFAL